MTRFPDWQARLSLFIYLHRNRSFRYGEWDCCLFAADAIQVMTGIDIAAEFRGLYSKRRDAYQLMHEKCGRASVRTAAESAASGYGMPQVTALYAQRGDMVLIPRARDYSLGIVSLTGKEIVVLRARSLMTIPLSYALLAWHV